MSNPYSKRNYHNYPPQQQPRSQNNKVHINPRFAGAPPPSTSSSSSVPSASSSTNYAEISGSLPSNSKVIVNPKVGNFKYTMQ